LKNISKLVEEFGIPRGIVEEHMLYPSQTYILSRFLDGGRALYIGSHDLGVVWYKIKSCLCFTEFGGKYSGCKLKRWA
jgi:hypothetical protein